MVKDIVTIASAIQFYYGEILQEDDMTEMKMHKLLYFAQKTHYKTFGTWLFEENFEGWVHGPVNRKVRSSYKNLPEFDEECLTLDEELTIREVIHEYGQYSAGVLRNMSHDDEAYKKSRYGLSEHDPGTKEIFKHDMIGDLTKNASVIEAMTY